MTANIRVTDEPMPFMWRAVRTNEKLKVDVGDDIDAGRFETVEAVQTAVARDMIRGGLEVMGMEKDMIEVVLALAGRVA